MSGMNDPSQTKVDPNNPTQRAMQGILAQELMQRFAYGPPQQQPAVSGAPDIHQQLYGASVTQPPATPMQQSRYNPQFMSVLQALLGQGLQGQTDPLPSGQATPGQGGSGGGYTQGPSSTPTGKTAKPKDGSHGQPVNQPQISDGSTAPPSSPGGIHQQPVSQPQFSSGPVAEAYRTILGREPDPQGYAFWQSQVAGMDPETAKVALAKQFMNSPEYKQKIATANFVPPGPSDAKPITSGSRMMHSNSSAFGGSRSNPHISNFRLR